jgi:hypothetical protein
VRTWNYLAQDAAIRASVGREDFFNPGWVKEGNVRKDAARSFCLRHTVVFAMFTGGAVAFTTLGSGLLLIQAHGNGWPWWFHGSVIASLTGFMAALITYFLCNSWLRDIERARNQERIIAELNHHVNNALTIIRARKSLPDMESDRIVETEIKRISWAIKEILPMVREGKVQDISDFPKHHDLSSLTSTSKR